MSSSEKKNSKSDKYITLAIVFMALLLVVAVLITLQTPENTLFPSNESSSELDSYSLPETDEGLRSIEVILGDELLRLAIPELDLRGYPLNHFEVERWFLARLNYHRENYGLHPYEIYHPTRAISIEHSLDMRDNSFSANESSEGVAHQDRHEVWMGADRTKITSTLSASYQVPNGPLTQEVANDIIDHLFEREDRHSFIMNPTYYFIGIGFSIEEDGMSRTCLTFASPPDRRAHWHALSPEEREVYVQEYLERVRAERGWTAP